MKTRLHNLKLALRKLIKKSFHTRIGRWVYLLSAEELNKEYENDLKLSEISIPEKLEGFEDLCFLFSCTPLNRRIIRVDLDEAAYIFKLVRFLDKALCVEIGRWKGGTTLLIAFALKEGRLISLDIHDTYDDFNLKDILRKFGLRDKVEIIVIDSTTYNNKGLAVDFIFIDGDHSYEKVKKDFEYWVNVIKKGGHIVFHDASAVRPYASMKKGVNILVEEIAKDKRLIKIKEVGSLSHFVKI
ncbi:MAG: class I SAM-dependent methyltransferase [Candidatus Omnitrophica bacterium]|jgi:predicted O-methyltransferase YrrM|nr:class I SAM-dependent methyltransferase [Candidatus Omnitrophota bacterium]